MIKLSDLIQAKIDKAAEAAVQQIADEIADNAEVYVPEPLEKVKDSIKVKVNGYQTRGPVEEWEDEEDYRKKKKGEHEAAVSTDDEDGMALEFGTRTTEANPFLSRAFYEELDSGRVKNIIVSEIKKELRKI